MISVEKNNRVRGEKEEERWMGKLIKRRDKQERTKQTNKETKLKKIWRRERR